MHLIMNVTKGTTTPDPSILWALFNFHGSNLTNGTYLVGDDITTDTSDSYGLPRNIIIALVCLYAVTILLSIGGNILVCYVVFALQRLRNVTNFYIVNLSCSDIIVTSVCIPFTVLSNLIYYYWPFGTFLCPLVMYIQLTAVMQRALTLVAMALDRHYAIWRPLKRRCSKYEAKFVIVMIWITSCIISLPTAIYTKIIYLPYAPGNQGLCTEVWDNHKSRYWYSLNIMMLQYFIPLAIMCITYIHIGIIVWIKRTPGEADNTRDIRLAASKRKIVKMLLVVVMAYLLCWLPLHVITITGDLNPTIYDNKHVHIAWLFSHWFAISNSFSNPIIYFCMNTTFNQGFKQVISGFTCHRRAVVLQRQTHQTSVRSASSNKSSSASNNAGENQTSKRLLTFARYD